MKNSEAVSIPEIDVKDVDELHKLVTETVQNGTSSAFEFIAGKCRTFVDMTIVPYDSSISNILLSLKPEVISEQVVRKMRAILKKEHTAYVLLAGKQERSCIRVTVTQVS